jgi:hypothetical protein
VWGTCADQEVQTYMPHFWALSSSAPGKAIDNESQFLEVDYDSCLSFIANEVILVLIDEKV